jgi:ribosomal protein S24E
MPSRDDGEMSVAQPGSLISREEVVAMLFNIADIAAEAVIIRELLKENGEAEEDQ